MLPDPEQLVGDHLLDGFTVSVDTAGYANDTTIELTGVQVTDPGLGVLPLDPHRLYAGIDCDDPVAKILNDILDAAVNGGP